MKKEAFLAELEKRLASLGQEELEERLAYYAESIDERVAGGMAEEEAVACLGPVEEAARQVISEMPMNALIRENTARRGRLKGWEIALLILGAPLWFPLLIAAASIVLAVFVTLWSVALSFFAADVGLAAGALAGLVGVGMYLKAGNPAGAALSLGAGLVCAGLAILLFFACMGLTRGLCRLCGGIVAGIKNRIAGKGE